MLLYPVSYAGIDISGMRVDGETGIHAQSFSMPAPKIINRLSEVAGGAVIDFNYGADAELRPQPFNVTFAFTAPTTSALNTLITGLLWYPPTGLLGSINTFVCRDAAGAFKSCGAMLSLPSNTISGSTHEEGDAFIYNISVELIPTTLFS
jgi:hypothetical protein